MQLLACQSFAVLFSLSTESIHFLVIQLSFEVLIVCITAGSLTSVLKIDKTDEGEVKG